MCAEGLFSVSNLASGLIGALFGVGASAAIYWHAGYSNSKEKLFMEITMLRDRFWWHPEGADPNLAFKEWNQSLGVLWPLWHAHYIWSFPWKKRRLAQAWLKYKGTSDEIVALAPDHKSLPRTREEFLQRINALLRSL